MEMINFGLNFFSGNEDEIACPSSCEPWDGKRCPSWLGCDVTYGC